jgi:hypothetical protein
LMCFLAKRRRRRACERTMRCLRRAPRTRGSATQRFSFHSGREHPLSRTVHSLRYFNHRLPFERGATRRRGSDDVVYWRLCITPCALVVHFAGSRVGARRSRRTSRRPSRKPPSGIRVSPEKTLRSVRIAPRSHPARPARFRLTGARFVEPSPSRANAARAVPGTPRLEFRGPDGRLVVPAGVEEARLLLVLLGDAQGGDGDAVPHDAEAGDEGPHLLRLPRGEGDHALVLVRHRVCRTTCADE